LAIEGGRVTLKKQLLIAPVNPLEKGWSVSTSTAGGDQSRSAGASVAFCAVAVVAASSATAAISNRADRRLAKR